MANQTSTNKKPDLPHSPAPHGQQNCRGIHRQHRNRWNGPGGGHPPKMLARRQALRTTYSITRAPTTQPCSTAPSNKSLIIFNLTTATRYMRRSEQ